MTTHQPRCFVVSPIGAPDSKTRHNADLFLHYIVGPIARGRGFHVVRADEMNEAGEINAQIVEALLDYELVVADLTDQNANVFYEVAIRHAARKPMVMMCTLGQSIPFDVAGIRAISYSTALPGSETAKEALDEQIQGILAGNEVPTPVSRAIDYREAQKGDQRFILAELEGLRHDIRAIGRYIDLRLPPRSAAPSAPEPGKAPWRILRDKLRHLASLDPDALYHWPTSDDLRRAVSSPLPTWVQGLPQTPKSIAVEILTVVQRMESEDIERAHSDVVRWAIRLHGLDASQFPGLG